MKHCPNCGAAIQDDTLSCPFCGIASGDAPAAAPSPAVAPAPVANSKKARKGKRGLAWTAVIAVYLILAIVVSCSFGLFDGLFDGFGSPSSVRNDDGNDDSDDSSDDVREDDRADDGDQPTQSTDPGTFDDNSSGESPLELEIKVWTSAEDQIDRNNWLVKMEELFAAAHPEYKITWVNESCFEGDAAGFVVSDVTAAADIYMYYSDQLNTLISAGALSPLGSSFEEQVKNGNSEFIASTVTHTDGKIYGFPVTNSTWFLYYNKDVYTEEDVKSLDTMLEKGKVCMPFTVGWNAGAFFWGVGGTVFGEKGNDPDAGVQFGDKGYDAALKMIEVAHHPNCIIGGMDVGKLISGEADAAFGGSWNATEVKINLGDKMGVAQLPSFTIDGQSYNMTALGGTKCVGVNPNSGKVEGKQKACTLFAAYLSSTAAQLERYNMRGVIPAAKALLENEAIKNDPVAVAEINTMANCTIIQSGLPEMNYVWTPLTKFAQLCYTGAIDESNYKAAVDALARQLTRDALLG